MENLKEDPKDWVCQDGAMRYCDQETGAMVRGDLVFDGIWLSFGPVAAKLKKVAWRE